MENKTLNFLCISTFFKGEDFLKACKAEGNNVYLLTLQKLENEAWPWDHIDDVFYLDAWVDEDVKNGIAYKFRSIAFDRFVALDDFDVEKVASLREHFRMPGMGETTARHFRDKLAMRFKAHEAGISVPPFTDLFNDSKINAYADTVQPPWFIKPRYEASAHGIKKIHNKEELWNTIHELGDKRQHFLLEKFTPGDVYHVDSLTFDGDLVFTRVSQYLDTPFEVAHEGGIFRSYTVELGSAADKQLSAMNEDVMKAFGLQFGASHTEFIRSHESGEAFFLETSSRVGGANLAEMVQAASGLNLWAEWARVESASFKKIKYTLPELKENMYGGIIVSLSRFEHPDTSGFADPEVVWRMHKLWHIGMIVVSDSKNRVLELLDEYAERIGRDFHASVPAPDKTVN